MKRKSVEKACVPFCKVFSTVCNYGECRQKLETDCEWYCECPPDCVGRFCEKLIKPGDSVTTSNPTELNGFAIIPNITLGKESTQVHPPMQNINGNESKVANLSVCPPEMINTNLNGTNDKVLTSGNISNTTESAKYSSNDEMNKTTLAAFFNLTKGHMVSDTTPAQSVNNTTMQQSVQTDAKLQPGRTVKPISANEHITIRNPTFSGFTSLERTIFTSTEKSTRYAKDVTSEKKLRTEISTLISLLKGSLDLQSFDVNETSTKSRASTAKPITTPGHVNSSIKHDFDESGIGMSKQTVELPIIPKSVTIVTTEKKQVSSDADFVQNNLNTSSEATFMSTEENDTVTISVANFKGNVPTGGSNLEEHTIQTDQLKQLRQKLTERESSPFISTSMPDQLSLTHIATGLKTSDQTTDRSSINLSISQVTTPVKKDEINASDIEMRTIKFNLTVRTNEYSTTHSMQILHTDVSPTTTTPLLNTLETVVDQPITSLGALSIEFKVPSGENKRDTGESMEVQNNFDNTTFKMMSSLGPTGNSNQSNKINKYNVETTTIDTITDAFTRRYIMTTVDQKLKSKDNSDNFNVATGNNLDNDFKVRLKDIKPESNSLAQSKTYDSQEILDTGKDSTFP
ncbi:hypothetical protein CHS0354_011634 [Potamilus streckersoni]|uniref:Uncharacterized protein n=1 Tax=Potamilus streckersoni TaxID=2493646 RepID=A0AAE0TKB7_9BIVA|nr:hypothetical protein CHS0354_011634 [Potamilus streckersoni]